MGWCRQYKAVMKKNCLLKGRVYCSTILEILLPVLIMFIIVGIRAAVSKDNFQQNSHISDGITFDPFIMSQQLMSNSKFRTQKIAFVPGSDPTIIQMMNEFKAAYPQMSNNVYDAFESEDEFNSQLTRAGYGTASNPFVYVGLIFHRVGTAVDPTWDYSVRLNNTFNPSTSTSIDTGSAPVNTLQTTYSSQWKSVLVGKGHMFFQHFIETFILSKSTYSPYTLSYNRTVGMIPFPVPPYAQDDFAATISTFLGLFFTLVYLWPVTRLIKGLVEEKEQRIKEGMKMMGLSESANICAWLTTYTFIFFFTALFITLITAPTVYANSNKALIFLFFFFFGLSTFGFCFLMSVFFNKATLATTVGALVFLASFFPYYAVEGSSHSNGEKGFASILTPISFSLGSVVIATLESSSTGVNSQNSNVMVDGWSYNSSIGMFIIDFLLYFAFGLYFDRVLPSEWGTPEPWYFLFTKRFWCPNQIRTSGQGDKPEHVELVEQHREPVAKDGAHIEEVSEAVRQNLGMEIRHLRKTFPIEGTDQEFVAVKDFNLDLFTGQILSLLGHNGAGKSTVLNMLCGMIGPTSGDAFVFGTSVKERIAEVRTVLGVCPQHNILFDSLSVREHLELFADIKGVPSKDIDAQVKEMIALVGLEDKTNYRTGALSGGMKRKLSVAIALLGGSKVVYLDEPTSGMDPFSRRATWELLKKLKNDRIIILTTHFMDEADQLGDRIAIMSKGDIKCVGSSLFLKRKYGVGYTLTLVHNDKFQEEEVTRMITENVPDVTSLSNIAGESSFRLPFQSSQNFPTLFDQFDSRLAELGIISYGISVTTLEEVFLRVGHDDEVDPTKRHEDHLRAHHSMSQGYAPVNKSDPAEAKSDNGTHTISVQPMAKSKSTHSIEDDKYNSIRISSDIPFRTLKHIRAVFIKRLHNAIRDRRVWTWTLIIPFVILLLGIAAITLTQVTSFKSLTVTSRDFNSPANTAFWSYNTDTSTPYASTFYYNTTYQQPVPYYNWIDPNTGNSTRKWTVTQNYSLYNTVGNLSPSYFFVDTVDNDVHPNIHFEARDMFTDQSPLLQGSSANASLTATLNQVIKDLVRYNLTYPGYPVVPSWVHAQTVAVSEFLRKDALAQRLSRYGAYITNPQFTSVNGQPVLVDQPVIFFNTTAIHGLPLHYNLYNTALLANLTGKPAEIIQRIHPMPITLEQLTLRSSITALIIAIGFAFIPANFISYAVKEEHDKVKHQQLISGMSAFAYWAGNFVWDFCNYMVMGLMCLLILRIWNVDTLIYDNTGATILAIVLFGLSVIPFNYLASFFFSSYTSAQNTMLLFYIVTGAILLIAMIILSIISSTQSIAFHLRFVCRIIPSYCFGESIANIIVRGSPAAFGSARTLWDLEITGYPMIFMTVEIFVYSALVLLVEYVRATPYWSRMLTPQPPHAEASPVEDEESDVAAERQRVLNGSGKNDMISIQSLRKVYKSPTPPGYKVAVDNLCLGIPEGQCFGFLGVNGAGKTTTLQMLGGDLIPSSGSASLHGFDILSQQNQVRRHLGYCPQFDALIDTLTAREHLFLFARIKGVDEAIIPEYVEHLVAKLGLQEGLIDKPTKGYSGGNKRKLCVGLAMIGNPPIIFLDEPSTGMDPSSRRMMWELIAQTMKGRSVMLTTHSMEECEALCQNIGIMVAGKLRCLGTTQHLKSKYGDAFQIDANVSAGPLQVSFQQWIVSNWSGGSLIECHGDNVKYRVPKVNADGTKNTLSSIFRSMEQHKDQFQLLDYSCQETTLEQIFIGFAKQSEHHHDDSHLARPNQNH